MNHCNVQKNLYRIDNQDTPACGKCLIEEEHQACILWVYLVGVGFCLVVDLNEVLAWNCPKPIKDHLISRSKTGPKKYLKISKSIPQNNGGFDNWILQSTSWINPNTSSWPNIKKLQISKIIPMNESLFWGWILESND